jgi:ABC-type multidrug transport system fused ATPase/permease subunit
MDTSTPIPDTGKQDLESVVLAFRRLQQRSELRERVAADEASAVELSELGLSPTALVRLRELLLAANRPKESNRESADAEAKNDAAVNRAEAFLEMSYGQLQLAYRISMAMSVTVFVLGVALLIAAGWQALVKQQALTAGILGGMGLGPLLALFFRNPLREIGVSVSNAQQGRMALQSYTLGVALVGRLKDESVKDALEQLNALTERSLAQLQRYVESDPMPPKTGD